MALSIVVFFSRCIGPTQCTTVWFATIAQNFVIHCSGLAPRDCTGQSGIAPRMRRLIWTGPGRIKCTLAFFDNFLQRANRASGCFCQRSIRNNTIHVVHAFRGDHVIGNDVRIRLQLSAARIVFAARIHPARPFQHGDLLASVFARQCKWNISHWNPGPNRWHLCLLDVDAYTLFTI